MSLAAGILILGLIVLGATAQRMAGLGFALLVSPLMTLVMGAHAGVLLVNICGVITSLIILPRVWRQVDWSMFRWLAGFAVFGAALGGWLSALGSPELMAVVVGAVVIVALTSSLLLSGARLDRSRRLPRGVAGFVSGLTNALAGVGGPPISAYAVLTRWPLPSLAATLQPYFAVLGTASAGAKLALDPGQLPPVPAWAWLLVAGGILLGVFAGERLLRVVSARLVWRLVIGLAFAGAAASLIRGLVGLLA